MASRAAAIDSSIFAALADPGRLGIVELLRSGPMSVNSISEALRIRQPQVSKHLKQLASLGLVRAEIQHRYRYYSLQPKAFVSLAKWTESFEQLYDNRLDNLGNYLNKQKRTKSNASQKR